MTLAQSIKKDIVGAWVCHEIIDSDRNPINGKYGNSGMYLSFLFTKNIMWTSKVPFEITATGIPYQIYKKDSIINFLGNRNKTLVSGEKNLKIKHLSNRHLVLQAIKENGDYINYVLSNAYINSCEREDSALIDNGLIIIKHLQLLNGKRSMVNRVFDYYVENNPSLFGNAPTFNDNETHSLGHFISNRIVFPKNFALDSISPILSVEFFITKNGANNFKIVNGISENIDNQISDILRANADKWSVLVCDTSILNVRNRLNFIFYYAEMDFPNIRIIDKN